jgi:hypothetical protein
VAAHYAKKYPPLKEVVPLKVSQRFVDMLEREPGHVEALRIDYDRSISISHWEMLQKKSGKIVPQLREQTNNRSPCSRCFLVGKQFPGSENRKSNRSPC